MIRVDTCTSIHQIKAATWDAFADGLWFHKHRFIASVEDANIPGARYWYLLFYDESAVVGNCVLSAFDISLDLFASENWFCRFIRTLWPGIFKMKVLMCGLPASFGQRNVHFLNSPFAEEIADRIVASLHQIAKQERISLLCVKELTERDRSLWRALETHDFFAAHSIPYMESDVRWAGFSEYLKSLRHPYRRSIKQSLRKIGLDEPVIYDQQSVPVSSHFPLLIAGDGSLCPPEQFYRMYRAVMARAATKLEILTLEFFQSLYKNMSKDLKLLVLKKNQTIYSAALLLQDDHALTFMLAGREQEWDEYDSYFNLIYGIVAMAIDSGVNEIKLGQTAYWVKQRIGAVPQDQYFLFHARKPIVHAALKKLNRYIFPAVKLPHPKVFKSE